MHTLRTKRLLLIVTGGIAAYKSPEIVRRMRDAGAEVQVVMTPAACQFITPLTLQAVSGHPVRSDLFDPAAEAAMGHIELARWCDAVVIAPATADFLARLRHGLAGDLATAVCLATTAPLLAAPAMNQQMWRHPATRDNLAGLELRGLTLAGPADGSQACGDFGPGRMVEPASVVAATAALFETGVLAGRSVLVTAGPTREPIDPVRYITNRSSGKMGYAVAAAAVEAGACVTLVSGPTMLALPHGVTAIDVETAHEMYVAVMQQIAQADVFISTAAVADYRVAAPAATKMKRAATSVALSLIPNEDILAAVAKRSPAPFTVGFAAETDDLERNARAKLESKGVDMIAANTVGGAGLGFDADDNELLAIWRGGEQRLARAPKARLARELVRLVAERMEHRGRAHGNGPRPARTPA